MNLILQLILVIIGAGFTIVILRYAFSNTGKAKEAFITIDGTKLSSKKEVDEYELIYNSLEWIYQDESIIKDRKRRGINKFNLSFIEKLKNEGFKDLKTLMSHREDLKNLAEIFQSSNDIK